MQVRLLIIDDDSFVRDLVGEMLAPLPAYQVHAASSGEEGLALLASSPFDLVLLDIDLGEGRQDGFEVCAGIMASEAPPAVIFLTSHARDDFVAAGLNAGARAYLCKPFSALELFEQLEAVSGGRC